MQLIKSLILVILIPSLIACSGEGKDDNGPVKDVFIATSLELHVNSQLMIASGESELTLHTTAYDDAGNSRSNLPGVKFVINGTESDNLTFSTSVMGEYDVYAKYEGIETPSVSFTALESKEYPIVEIPVIFHVGQYEGQDYSHVNEAYVEKLIELLNKGFSNENNSKNLNAVDTGVRFRLASIDPNGNQLAEKGITKFDAKPYDDGGAHYSPFGELYNTPSNVKFGSFEVYRMANDQHWPQHLYKNVYIAPTEDANWAVHYQLKDNSEVTISGIEQGKEYFEDGNLFTDILLLKPQDKPESVVVHEMGHSLGLLHPESYDACVTGDFVADTLSIDFQDHEYVCEEDSLGQTFLTDSKTLRLDNFMHGANRWEVTNFTINYDNFTYGQRERMRLVITEGKYISELINSDR